MRNVKENIITAILYSEMDENMGPTPIFSYPADLSHDIQMDVCIKALTMLATDKGVIPDSLVFIPFPSLKLKGIIKYMERKDDTKRGGVVQASLTLLFKEIDDLIFYKYSDNLEKIFTNSAQKILTFNEKKSKNQIILSEIANLHQIILDNLENLCLREISPLDKEPFPEGGPEPSKKPEYVFKIIFCGDTGVGKTSIILRFIDNVFKRTYLPTLGTNICEKAFTLDGKTVKLISWDVAGQAKFQIMRKHFYLGSDGIMLVFDLTNEESFNNIEKWCEDIKKYLEEADKKIGFIIGNKSDLVADRVIDKKRASELAKKLNLKYFETSALTGENIESSFFKLSEALIESKKTKE